LDGMIEAFVIFRLGRVSWERQFYNVRERRVVG